MDKKKKPDMIEGFIKGADAFIKQRKGVVTPSVDERYPIPNAAKPGKKRYEGFI